MTNHHMAGLTGSETATWTIARALKTLGHKVSLGTLVPGLMSEALEADGIPSTGNLAEWAGREFDVCHCHHNSMAEVVREVFPALPMLYYGHGPLPALEAPPPPEIGVAVHAAVSEEVAGVWRNSRPDLQEVHVVRNAVDVFRFRPAREPSYFYPCELPERPGRVLVISHQLSLVQDACAKLSPAPAVAFIGGEEPTWEVEERIREADLVCTVGRGILEAMSCGRVALVLNQVLGDGLLTPALYETVRRSNFSGRAFRRRFTAEDLAREIRDYRPGYGTWGRERVHRSHEALACALTLTRLYAQATRLAPAPVCKD